MQTQALSLDKDKEIEIVEKMNQRSDTIMFRFLIGYGLFGIVIAPFYDTWMIGIVMAVLSLGSWFFIKSILPTYTLHRYVASAFLGVFVGSFIYQMHGLFEMHFFAFIASAILIVYQDWKLQIPMIAIVVVHHGAFAYLQYAGVPDIYFTQLQYMDMTTFIFHIGLAATVVVVCGYWAYRFRKMTIIEAVRSLQISNKMNEVQILNKKLEAASKILKTKNIAIEDKNKELEDSKQKLINITEKQADLYRQMREGSIFKEKEDIKS